MFDEQEEPIDLDSVEEDGEMADEEDSSEESF
jgi:hypothetical protein